MIVDGYVILASVPAEVLIGPQWMIAMRPSHGDTTPRAYCIREDSIEPAAWFNDNDRIVYHDNFRGIVPFRALKALIDEHEQWVCRTDAERAALLEGPLTELISHDGGQPTG
jgi:hypothetical protein